MNKKAIERMFNYFDEKVDDETLTTGELRYIAHNLLTIVRDILEQI